MDINKLDKQLKSIDEFLRTELFYRSFSLLDKTLQSIIDLFNVYEIGEERFISEFNQIYQIFVKKELIGVYDGIKEIDTYNESIWSENSYLISFFSKGYHMLIYITMYKGVRMEWNYQYDNIILTNSDGVVLMDMK